MRGVCQFNLEVNAEQGLIVSWGGFNSKVPSEARDQFFSIRLWDSGDLIQAVLDNYGRLAREIQAELPLKQIWVLMPGPFGSDNMGFHVDCRVVLLGWSFPSGLNGTLFGTGDWAPRPRPGPLSGHSSFARDRLTSASSEFWDGQSSTLRLVGRHVAIFPSCVSRCQMKTHSRLISMEREWSRQRQTKS